MSVLCSLLLALAVGLSPFWLGSNRPLPWAAHGLVFGGLLMATAVAILAEGRRYPALKLGQSAWPLVLIGLGLGWAVLELVPADGLLAVHPAWAVVADTLQIPVSGAISINPHETSWALLRWFTAAAVLLASCCLARQETNAVLMLRVLLILAALAGMYGLVRLSLSLDKILWFDEPDTGYLTSGFINRNSAATYFGMASLAALGLVLARALRLLDRTRELSSRQRTEAWTSALSGTLGLDLVVFVLLFVSLLATGSRGGILFTLAAMLVMLLLYSLRRRSRHGQTVSGAGWILILVLSAFLVVSLFELAGVRVMSRLADEGLKSTARLDTYRQTLVAIGDYLWLGSGLGTFQDVFPAYRLEIAPGRHVWDKAHNDYLELILGLGLPAASLVLLGFAGLFWKVLRGFFSRRRNQHYAAIAVGVSILAGLHSLVDFSLQIQANTLIFALLMGLGLAQSISSRETA